MAIEYLNSSNLKAIEFDPSTEILIVYFNSGYTYEYFGVPEKLVNELRKAQSIGKYFQSNIRETYPFKRINKRAV